MVGFLFFTAGISEAALVNGDFETGDFTGWTTFRTTDYYSGPYGSPVDGAINEAVVTFDTNGNGTATQSASFGVGRGQAFSDPATQGGGIYQVFTSGAGVLNLAADIAARTILWANGEGGVFMAYLDGVLIASYSFGEIEAGATERSTLSGSTTVAAGSHELRFLITRDYTVPYQPNGELELIQYIDNIVLSGGAMDTVPASVPEPATMLLLGFGLAGIAVIKKTFRP